MRLLPWNKKLNHFWKSRKNRMINFELTVISSILINQNVFSNEIRYFEKFLSFDIWIFPPWHWIPNSLAKSTKTFYTCKLFYKKTLVNKIHKSLLNRTNRNRITKSAVFLALPRISHFSNFLKKSKSWRKITKVSSNEPEKWHFWPPGKILKRLPSVCTFKIPWK